MIYDASISLDQKRSKERLEWLISKEKVFELKEKRKTRSLSQNRYLHLILSWFGLEFGYELEEVKQFIFKQEVNPDLFYNGETEGIVKVSRWRSTSTLDTAELTTAIDRFRDFSSKHGCYLPEPSDLAAINEMERELLKKSSKQYL